MKKADNSKKIIVGVLVGVLVLLVAFVIASNFESREIPPLPSPTDNVVNGNEAPTDNVEDDGTLLYIGNAEMYEILNDRSGEGFFVYIGRPTCPNCRDFEPVLREALRSIDGQMRYFQTDIAREADDVSEMTMIEILNSIGVSGVPSTVFIVNGEVVDRLGARTPESIISFIEDNGGLN